MEQIVQMQDDIHKVKKLMDTAFEKLGKQSSDALYDPAEAYADKDRIIELLNRLTSRMGEAEVSNLTATPKTDATMEEIMALKKSSHRVEMERQSINRRAGACVKGIL
uniref:Uncharacterized protein AlNc14C199G8638 n=1 Tax=Albugo laibachii Nc14 TaxID=890382 RepID=F0WQG7_9STRA|nr:conserved hypothetical protein [Albugo laibachii Nc14]|eukprot:CCA23576.1 conserved hypothetical protein [Albugo laibachii Nc14]